MLHENRKKDMRSIQKEIKTQTMRIQQHMEQMQKDSMSEVTSAIMGRLEEQFANQALAAERQSIADKAILSQLQHDAKPTSNNASKLDISYKRDINDHTLLDDISMMDPNRSGFDPIPELDHEETLSKTQESPNFRSPQHSLREI